MAVPRAVERHHRRSACVEQGASGERGAIEDAVPRALPCGLILAKHGRGRRLPRTYDRAPWFFIAFSALFFIALMFIALSALFLIAFFALFLRLSDSLRMKKRQGFMPWRVAPLPEIDTI